MAEAEIIRFEVAGIPIPYFLRDRVNYHLYQLQTRGWIWMMTATWLTQLLHPTKEILTLLASIA